MKTTSIETKYTGSPIKIAALGDDHIGSANCCIETLKANIKKIKDEKLMWIHLGDGIDAITVTDAKRKDYRSLDGNIITDFEDLDRIIEKEVEYFCDMYSPIADNCIAMLDGNHPEGLRRRQGIDPYFQIWNRLFHKRVQGKLFKRKFGSIALGYDGYVLLDIKTKTSSIPIKIYLHHGWTAARTRGAIVNNLYKAFTCRDMDIFICGHGHQVADVRLQTISPTKTGELIHNHKLGIMTPTFLKTYSEGDYEGYSGRAGYDPAYIGSVEVSINPEVYIKKELNRRTPFNYVVY